MRLIIDISEYNVEYIKNAYGIPQDINMIIAEAIINGKQIPTPHGRLIDAEFEEMHYTSITTNPTPDVTEQDKRNSLIIIKALQMAKTIIEEE